VSTRGNKAQPGTTVHTHSHTRAAFALNCARPPPACHFSWGAKCRQTVRRACGNWAVIRARRAVGQRSFGAGVCSGCRRGARQCGCPSPGCPHAHVRNFIPSRRWVKSRLCFWGGVRRLWPRLAHDALPFSPLQLSAQG